MVNIGDDRLLAEAFGKGSDSRLRGEPITSNPYVPGVSGKGCWSAWRCGWQDADAHWGEECGGWVIRRLPSLEAVGV